MKNNKKCDHIGFTKSVKVEDTKGNRGEMYYCSKCKEPIKMEAV